jgi:hypothetical protein
MRHWVKHILAAGVLVGCTPAPGHDASGGAAATTAAPATAATAAPASPAESAATVSPAGTIASGSNLALASMVRLCTGVSKAGDAFTATVTGSVIGSHGAVIPVGSVVIGHVADVRDSLLLSFDSLAVGTQSYAITARMVGSPQTVSERSRGKLGGLTDNMPPQPGMTVMRVRVLCIPERGRMTIQLTADLPLQ